MARMLASARWNAPVIVLATVNSVLQRLPSREFVGSSVISLQAGKNINMDKVTSALDAHGFIRTGTVMEPGEYARRGGIVDLFPPGREQPVRLDFFGDTLESLRKFDPQTQRTSGRIKKLILLPASEVPAGSEAIQLFRQRYTELFGAITENDPLYEAVSQGIRYQGMEHWLPLFHKQLDTIFDYLPDALISLDHLSNDAMASRHEQIDDHYTARSGALEQEAFGAAAYNPVPAELLFLSEKEWQNRLTDHRVRYFSPFDGNSKAISMHSRIGHNFAAVRTADNRAVFDEVIRHIGSVQTKGKRVIIAAWSNGGRERLAHLLKEHGLQAGETVDNWPQVLERDAKAVSFAVLGLEHGFVTADIVVIGEQDILGDRLLRPRKKTKSSADVLTEASSITAGDLIAHVEHGIGRFVGLKTIEAAGAPHDCLELEYYGGDKLFLPVENIELLSRYGSEDASGKLDKLGGAAWQAKKARLKKRIRDIAGKLIEIAALRELRSAPEFHTEAGSYDEFAARFQFEETDDQMAGIDAVLEDLASGKPMDRLICGDVGFGKTEVALRAAFATVMSGKQVAVVVPTTLLARQHFKTFGERFSGYPVRVEQASRLVGSQKLAQVKKALKSGQVDIVVGTHALLGKAIEFSDLGLLIIDEEQHFGVRHKEQIKRLREDVHVLTLTATPIPRTLQLSLSGVRDLSLITTPPVDRLAVRTFITPFDTLVLREALLRERYRGGQTFYVCPRISDLDDAGNFLAEHVPELKVARAHGQMTPERLEDVMNAFYDRQYDVLLSTSIVESGLDVPSANTLIVHRADMFGLAQLYQLRGRVGRSKTRAYAYFTTPVGKELTPAAEKRLKVLHSLDTLGAGFTLASHDLDIRGAGNLLGEEQSGHIREVGFELYQSMLEEAVASLKSGGGDAIEDQWSPQISIGAAVLIPENYVSDIQVRMGLYRRLSNLDSEGEVDSFAVEMVDRFGSLPVEVEHLLTTINIKILCRKASVAKLDAGPKGAVIGFHKNIFPNPDALLGFVAKYPDIIKVQQDGIVYKADWPDGEARLKGAYALAGKLAELVA
jgi:transcription-repair coupling factor (superfamily II helicase)